MSYKTEFQANNADLQAILEQVNSLPDASSTPTYTEYSFTINTRSGQGTYNITNNSNETLEVVTTHTSSGGISTTSWAASGTLNIESRCMAMTPDKKFLFCIFGDTNGSDYSYTYVWYFNGTEMVKANHTGGTITVAVV